MTVESPPSSPPSPSPSHRHPAPGSDAGHIRCVCGDGADDGFTIQCERCLCWQHAKCVGISKSSVPEEYACELCNPASHERLHAAVLSSLSLPPVLEGAPTGPPGPAPHNTGPPGGPRPAPGPSRPRSVPLGAPELGENIVSPEARPVLAAHVAALCPSFPGLLARMPRAPGATGPLPNFALEPVVALESVAVLDALRRPVEVRDIRARGHQRRGAPQRTGLFTLDALEPGQLVTDYLGLLQVRSLLFPTPSPSPSPTTPQPMVLFPSAALDLVVDARKFGNAARHCRRSCRSNVLVKPLLLPDSLQDDASTGTATGTGTSPRLQLRWALFARNIVRPGQELLLPLDWATGNPGLLRYDCACGLPDFCLAPPDMLPHAPGSDWHAPDAAGSARHAEAPDAAAPALRRAASVGPFLDPAPPATAPQTRPIIDARKLSREERKLQKYIEYFERMDQQEAVRKASAPGVPDAPSRRKSSSAAPSASVSASASVSVSASASASVSASVSASASSTAPSSPPAAPPAGLKKSWTSLFIHGAPAPELPSTDGPAAPPAKAKRGRRPKPPSDAPEPSTDAPAPASIAPVSVSVDDDQPGLPLPAPRKRAAKKQHRLAANVVDIMLDDAEPAPTTLSAPLARIPAPRDTIIAPPPHAPPSSPSPSKKARVGADAHDAPPDAPLPCAPPTETGDAIDPSGGTPEKKRLTLSDYLKKKKASPAGTASASFDELGAEAGASATPAQGLGASASLPLDLSRPVLVAMQSGSVERVPHAEHAEHAEHAGRAPRAEHAEHAGRAPHAERGHQAEYTERGQLDEYPERAHHADHAQRAHHADQVGTAPRPRPSSASSSLSASSFSSDGPAYSSAMHHHSRSTDHPHASSHSSSMDDFSSLHRPSSFAPRDFDPAHRRPLHHRDQPPPAHHRSRDQRDRAAPSAFGHRDSHSAYRDSRDAGREYRDPRDPRDTRDARDIRDSRDARDTRDTRDSREHHSYGRDYRESRDSDRDYHYQRRPFTPHRPHPPAGPGHSSAPHQHPAHGESAQRPATSQQPHRRPAHGGLPYGPANGSSGR